MKSLAGALLVMRKNVSASPEQIRVPEVPRVPSARRTPPLASAVHHVSRLQAACARTARRRGAPRRLRRACHRLMAVCSLRRAWLAGSSRLPGRTVRADSRRACAPGGVAARGGAPVAAAGTRCWESPVTALTCASSRTPSGTLVPKRSASA